MAKVMEAVATVASVMAWFERSGSPTAAAGLARYGLPTTNAYGISVGTLRARAKQLGTDHALAMKLWKTGSLEARILASFLAQRGRDKTLAMPPEA